MGQRSRTSRFQSGRGIGFLQAQHALRSAQSFDDAIGQQARDQFGTGGANPSGLFKAPGPVMGEEGSCIRWQMVIHRAPITVLVGSPMSSHTGLKSW